jgi:hypothetical protein
LINTKDDVDDPPGRGNRVHPLLHLLNHKKAAKKFTKEVLIADGFAAGEADDVLARLMMNKLRKDNAWPGAIKEEHWPIENIKSGPVKEGPDSRQWYLWI